MSSTRDHSKQIRGVQEPYSHYHTPLMDGVAGTSKDTGKSTAEDLSSASLGDETQVNSELLNTWMQRLQILTVVTTFLSSIDGVLFSLTALNTHVGVTMSTTACELVYSCLAGALILHICAAILGYVASFALIRYRIVDASGDDEASKVGGALFFSLGTTQPAQRLSRKIVLEPVRPLDWLATFSQRSERLRSFSVPHRSSRHPSPPPLALLMRCYYTTLCLTAVGFVLALTGILSYIWAGLRVTVGIFSTVCLVVAIGAGMWAIAI